MGYDNQTKVFTNNGWRYFKDIDKKDLLLIRKKEGLTEWSVIKDKKESNFNGSMYHVNCSDIDLLVTPDHKIPLIEQNKKNYYFKTIKDIVDFPKKFANYFIPETFKWEGINQDYFVIPPVWYMRLKNFTPNVTIHTKKLIPFLGWWISCGTLFKLKGKKDFEYKAEMPINKEENVSIIKSTLKKKFPFNYKVLFDKSKTILTLDSKQFWTYLKSFGKSFYERCIPEEIKNLSPNTLNTLLNNFLLNKEDDYTIQSKNLVLDLQEIAYKCGYKLEIKTIPLVMADIFSIFFIGTDKLRKKYFQTYKICISKIINKSRSLLQKKLNISTETYKGKVYSVELENGNVIWVRRNLKCSWSSGGSR